MSVLISQLSLMIVLAAAGSPSDSLTPPDSLIKWLGNRCDLATCYKAFSLLDKMWWTNYDETGRQIECYRIDSTYYHNDSLRAMYREFVHDLLLNGNLRERCGSNFKGRYELGYAAYDDNTDWEGQESELPRVFRIYRDMGFTDKLYELADSIYELEPGSRWRVYEVLHDLGRGYLQYLRVSSQSDTGNLLPIRIANDMLYSAWRDSSIADVLCNILCDGMRSENARQRVEAGSINLWNLSDWPELKPDVIKLLESEYQRILADTSYLGGLEIARGYLLRGSPVEWPEAWKPAMRIVIAGAKSQSVKQRLKAVYPAYSSWEYGHKQLVDLLKELMNDPDPEVRKYAIQLVGDRGKRLLDSK